MVFLLQTEILHEILEKLGSLSQTHQKILTLTHADGGGKNWGEVGEKERMNDVSITALMPGPGRVLRN